MINSLLPLLTYFGAPGDACKPTEGNFLGFPTWYHYLQGTVDANNNCVPGISGINDIWLIVAAVIEILLRIAALAAIGLIIYGGIQFITSQGNPDQAERARNTVINALVGLVIAVAAATLVTFVAGRFQG